MRPADLDVLASLLSLKSASPGNEQDLEPAAAAGPPQPELQPEPTLALAPEAAAAAAAGPPAGWLGCTWKAMQQGVKGVLSACEVSYCCI